MNNFSIIQWLPQILMMLCTAAYVSIYLKSLKQNKVKPVLATWLFISLASFLSVITHFRENGVEGLFANAFNICTTIAVTSILVLILFKKDTRRTFNLFEKCCLGAVIFVFLGWLITGQNVLAHLAVQVISVVAYLPTLVHLWNAKYNTEPIASWSFDTLASAFGLIAPLLTMDFLPFIYGLRSMLSSLAVVILILRLNHKNKINPQVGIAGNT